MDVNEVRMAPRPLPSDRADAAREVTRRALNRDQLRALPATIDLAVAALALGIGRSAAYELVRTDNWPTPVLHLGHRIKIPTQPLLILLGLSPDTQPLDPGLSSGPHHASGPDPHW